MPLVFTFLSPRRRRLHIKQCSACKKELPFSDFYPDKRMKLGLQSQCKKCAREWHRDRPEYIRTKNAAWKGKNPRYMRDWQRKKKFGLTKEQVDQIRNSQNGLCAGCLTSLADAKECLDHDHLTGRIRGLLCNDCNLVLGRAKDSTETLLRLVNYLTRKEAEDY